MSDSSSNPGTEPAHSAATNDKKAPRIEWLLLVVAAGIAVPLWKWRGNHNGAETTIMARITLVTSDREDLACASLRTIKDLGCSFETAEKARLPAPAHPLAPYMTEDHQMFLLPGLFEQPSLKKRYESEPPTAATRETLRRFTAVCKLRLVEKIGGVQVRWVQNQPFSAADNNAWVAKPIACKVEG